MYKHTEVAERLGFTRQALDKHRKQLEQQLGRELGSIQGNARVYSVAELQQLREQLPEIKQAGIDRILGAIELSTPGEIETGDWMGGEVLATRKMPRYTFSETDDAARDREAANEFGDEAQLSTSQMMAELRRRNLQQADRFGARLGREFVEQSEVSRLEVIANNAKKQGVKETESKSS